MTQEYRKRKRDDRMMVARLAAINAMTERRLVVDRDHRTLEVILCDHARGDIGDAKFYEQLKDIGIVLVAGKEKA